MQGQDQRGWLLSCDQNRQPQALKDAYNFLTQYIQQVYDDLVTQAIQKKLKQQNKQLSLQTQLKQAKKKQNRLLFSIQTNVKCIIFVKINNRYNQIDPVLIVDRIMEDVYLRNKMVTRFCHRILPVQRVFKAEHFRMLTVVEELFAAKTQQGEIRSWALNFKCRNNSKFNYKEVLRECEKIASKYGHFVDIYYPQWTVSIQITNHLMCITISQKYKEYNQYKLHKKMPKQQSQPGDKKQKQFAQNEQLVQKLDKQQQNQLKTQKQLRELLNKQQNKNSEPVKINTEQKKTSQLLKITQQANKSQLQKSNKSNKRRQLLQQKIPIDEEDDVQFF